MKTSTDSSDKKVTASDFRRKVAQMKSWIPDRTPTNIDKLELYALHKQAVASDAPDESTITTKTKLSPAERAKRNAWSTKRSMSQSQAMRAYILEADRQIAVYGTASSTTPTNTPEDNNNSETGSTTTTSVLLTPRGLAAVPLLCAAASESRPAYLARLENNFRSNECGWWMRQEPLCGDPGTVSALPEILVLTIAILVERLSLHLLSDSSRNVLDTIRISPAVVQSLLWPLHNVLLVVWIMVIFISTISGSAILTLKTMLLGSKRTGVSLENIFSQEIKPCKVCVGSLCVPHQTASVRFLGLVLYPLGMICNLADNITVKTPLGEQTGIFLGAGTYLLVSLLLWWYWFIALPWVAAGGVCLSFSLGWCFGLMELANI